MSDIGPDYWLTTNYAAQLDDLSDKQHNLVKELVRAVWREAENQSPSMDDIAFMIDDARSSALEEAAKVADARARVSRLADKPSQLIHVSMTLAQFEAEAIATGIRALKEGAKP